MYTNEALFSYSKSTPQAINYSLLESANLAVVQQPRVDAGLRENLKRLLDRGGSVVIVPPADAAGRASYSQLFQELGLGAVQTCDNGNAWLQRCRVEIEDLSRHLR